MYKQVSMAILFIFTFAITLQAQTINWDQELYNSIYFSENELIIDLNNIKHSLSKGANPNWISVRKNKDESVLSKYVHLISLTKNNTTDKLGIEAINLLIKNRVKMQYCDSLILFWPITQGKYDLVKILLENGADANYWPKKYIGENYNFSPIEQAITDGHDDIVRLLIEYGATKTNKRQAHQLRLIGASKFGTIAELINEIKMGANVNLRNVNGETALINALNGIYNYDTYQKIKYMLGVGADPNMKGNGSLLDHSNPLNEAIYNSIIYINANNWDATYAKQILQLLIKKGAYVSGRDDNNQTPLHIAAMFNNLFAAELLISSGSKIIPKDKYGKTPLDYAQSAEMIKLLKEHGAIEQ